MVPSLWHSGTMEVTEQDALAHSAMQEGRGEEETVFGGEEEGGISSRAFSAYGHPLDMVTSFWYLGRVISAADDDWPAVVSNLSQERVVC